MSIKFGLLALLSEGDAYGYVLRSRFEDRTGGVWPLNIGQVYTTLTRLERDGLVSSAGTDGDGRVMYALTDAGRAELSTWWSVPVARGDRPRDELAIKIALAVTTPGVDAAAVLQAQRSATMRSLQDLTRLKRHGAGRASGGRETGGDDGGAELSWQLVLESMVFAAEAEVRWLDYCETSLVRAATGKATASVATAAAGATSGATVARSGAMGGIPPQSPATPEPTATRPCDEAAADRRVRS